MSFDVVDLFAGGGGFSTAARDAGCNVLWAANHNEVAVKYHGLNHPMVKVICQDLHQANWDDVPAHDLMLASPCCQGHSKAAGVYNRSKKADASRSTAWAPVSNLEVNQPEFGIIENVTDFKRWSLYGVWTEALRVLGYSVSEHIIDLADLGVPQSRVRLFVVLSRSKNPIILDLPKLTHIPARTILDLNHENYEWDHVSNRVEATQRRVANGRNKYGNLFLDAAYGNERGGRDIGAPLGTVKTVNVHSLVKGNYIRPLTIAELARAQSFADDYIWPEGKVITKSLIGNAVPPRGGKVIIEALLKAA
ncbi:MAG: DNA cytosine methyltransferase [Pseudomonadota bacterium]